MKFMTSVLLFVLLGVGANSSAARTPPPDATGQLGRLRDDFNAFLADNRVPHKNDISSQFYFAFNRYGDVKTLQLPMAFVNVVLDFPSDRRSFSRDVEAYLGPLFGDVTTQPRDPVSSTSPRLAWAQDEYSEGIRVFGASLRWEVNASNDILFVTSSLVPKSTLPNCSPAMGPTQAMYAASESIFALGSVDFDEFVATSEYGIATTNDASPVCAWRVTMPSRDGGAFISYVPDRDTRPVWTRYVRYADAEPTRMYFANYNMDPADDLLLCQNGGCGSFLNWPAGASVELANEYATEFSAYLLNEHGRYGWDDNTSSDPSDRQMSIRADAISVTSNGAVFDATVNAVKIGPSSVCRDAIAHEFSHGIALATNGELFAQGLWIVDGIGDGIGEVFEEYSTGSADWLHGTSGTCTTPKRNLADPPSLSDIDYGPFPDNFWNYKDLSNDQHWNAAIIGKLAYLAGRPTSSGAVSHWGHTVLGIGAPRTGTALLAGITGSYSASDSVRDIAARMLLAVPINPLRLNLRGKFQEALFAVGIWTLDMFLSINSSTPVSIVQLDQFGTTITVAIYTDPVDGKIKMRTSTCGIGCGWSSPTEIFNTGYVPGLWNAITFQNKIYVLVDIAFPINTLTYRTIDSNLNISPSTGYIASAAVFPSPTVYNDRLYVFYRDVGNGVQPIRHVSTAGSDVWTTPIQTPASSQYGPAVAGNIDGRLWLFYGAGNSATVRLRYRKMTVGEVFGESSYVPNMGPLALGEYDNFLIGGTPLSTTSNGRLYLVWPAGPGQWTGSTYGSASLPNTGWTRRSYIVGYDDPPAANVSWATDTDNLYFLWRSTSGGSDMYLRRLKTQ